MRIEQLLLLQNLLHNYLWSSKGVAYQPNQHELETLNWFLYLYSLGEAERLEILRRATLLGLEPPELVALRWLAERLIIRKE